MSGERSSVKVEPVEAQEVPNVINFLRSGFVPHLVPEVLRGLFEYRWSGPQEKPNLGFALRSGNRIVGFLGVVYAVRPLAGQTVKVCNLSTWYVEPKFRWASMKLLYAVMSQKEYMITNFTASPGVRKVMEALGFKTIDHQKLVYLPWHFPLELLGRHRCEVLVQPADIEDILRGDERQLFQDHLPYRVKHYVLRAADRHSYIVFKRRSFPGEAAFSRIRIKKLRLMWYPCMEVLYLGNPELAADNWASLVATVIRSERVLAVVVAERFMGDGAPDGTRLDHRNYLLTRAPLDSTVDSLYSELVVM
jgi:acetoacetyl-CoA synthetase